MFRSLFRTATPFLKTTAKKVGKRLLNTGLDTGMQIAQDVIKGQLRKLRNREQRLPVNDFLRELFRTLHNKGAGGDYLSANGKRLLPVQDRPRNGEHHLQSSKRFSTKDGLSTPTLQAFSYFKYQSPMFPFSKVNGWIMNQFKAGPIPSSLSSNLCLIISTSTKQSRDWW